MNVETPKVSSSTPFKTEFKNLNKEVMCVNRSHFHSCAGTLSEKVVEFFPLCQFVSLFYKSACKPFDLKPFYQYVNVIEDDWNMRILRINSRLSHRYYIRLYDNLLKVFIRYLSDIVINWLKL